MTKTVLITGASSGIGKASVEAFAAAGWQVAATSRKPDKRVFEQFSAVRVYNLDVTNEVSIQKVFADVIKDFGSIDAVVNNAGYGLDGIFEAMDDAQIRAQFETNVFGLMNVTREAIKRMRPARSGKIIQVASMGGRLTFPLYSVYHSSKWAVEGFSEALQYELRSFGIQIKIIEPGAINTAFYGQNRVRVKPQSKLGYDLFVSKVDAVSQRGGAHGESPAVVAKTILKAANSSSNKMRYVVGSPAPILFVLRKVLPDRVFLRLIRLNYRI